MKKFYILVLFALGVAGMCMAQDDVVTAVTINNWDGSYKSPNMPLYIGVGEMRILNLTLEPENANDTTFHLGMVMEEGDQESMPIGFWGMEVGAYRAATRTLNIWDNEWTKILASTQITAYETEGNLDGDTTKVWSIWYDYETEETILTITQTSETGEPGALADRGEGVTYPWDELGAAITRLQIEGDFSYIGSGVFDALYNLQNIQFTGNLSYLHADAFSISIHPWKFAFGNPQDGALVPPEVEFAKGSEEKGLEYWRHMFSESTVLYVPDSAFEYLGRPVHAVDLYRGHDVWGSVFNRIDDHTVAKENMSEEEIMLSWLPQERATEYLLRIQKVGCEECDTTIAIEAFGEQGLLEPIEKDAPRHVIRIPKGDDGSGGMTLTIDIDGGLTHTQDVMVTVSGMAVEDTYSFSRVVMQDGVESPALTKEGIFRSPAAQAIVNTQAENGTGTQKIFLDGSFYIVRGEDVYDFTGRKVQ